MNHNKSYGTINYSHDVCPPEAGMIRAARVTGHEVVYSEVKEKYGYRVGLAKTVEDADRILDSL